MLSCVSYISLVSNCGLEFLLTHDEGVVERSEDMRDAEHVLPLRHLRTKGNPFLHLSLSVPLRLWKVIGIFRKVSVYLV